MIYPACIVLSRENCRLILTSNPINFTCVKTHWKFLCFDVTFSLGKTIAISISIIPIVIPILKICFIKDITLSRSTQIEHKTNCFEIVLFHLLPSFSVFWIPDYKQLLISSPTLHSLSTSQQNTTSTSCTKFLISSISLTWKTNLPFPFLIACGLR